MNETNVSWQRFWCNKWVDQTIACCMVLVSLWLISESVLEKKGLALFVVITTVLIHNLLLLVRFPPRRVSVSLSAWVVAILGANWHLLFGLFSDLRAIRVAPHWFSAGIAFFGAMLFVWARLNLGRNFGVVPAQRNLVTFGVYRLVRHPIYTASILTSSAHVMANVSWVNVLVWASGILLLLKKTANEEAFLVRDANYRAYVAKVPDRFIPGVV